MRARRPVRRARKTGAKPTCRYATSSPAKFSVGVNWVYFRSGTRTSGYEPAVLPVGSMQPRAAARALLGARRAIEEEETLFFVLERIGGSGGDGPAFEGPALKVLSCRRSREG